MKGKSFHRVPRDDETRDKEAKKMRPGNEDYEGISFVDDDYLS